MGHLLVQVNLESGCKMIVCIRVQAVCDNGSKVTSYSLEYDQVEWILTVQHC